MPKSSFCQIKIPFCITVVWLLDLQFQVIGQKYCTKKKQNIDEQKIFLKLKRNTKKIDRKWKRRKTYRERMI